MELLIACRFCGCQYFIQLALSVSVEISSVDLTPCSLVRTYRRSRGKSAFKMESTCFYSTIYKYIPSYMASYTRRNQSS